MHLFVSKPLVASFAEAWIEIPNPLTSVLANVVASFAEAWIEIITDQWADCLEKVASFAEAWIEILLLFAPSLLRRRLLRGGVD